MIDNLNLGQLSISFEEFLEALARCAMIAYNYQVRLVSVREVKAVLFTSATVVGTL